MLLISATIVCFAVVANAAEPATSAPLVKPLIFGLLPSESAVTKFKRYAPLRDYLSRKLKRPIVLETARNFPEFLRRTSVRRYDFLETAPHFVPQAVDSGHYRVLTTIIQPLSAQVVVRKDSAWRSLKQLAGKKVATPSPKAIITKVGIATFSKLGLRNSRSPVYKTYQTHNAAYEAVLGRQADAAIISVNVFNKAIKQGEPLRSIGASRSFPNMSILGAANLPKALRQKLRITLSNMVRDKDGQKVLRQTAYPGYRPATKAEFAPLRRYMKPSP
jgi:phosphonate transport system substrate-binding protein